MASGPISGGGGTKTAWPGRVPPIQVRERRTSPVSPWAKGAGWAVLSTSSVVDEALPLEELDVGQADRPVPEDQRDAQSVGRDSR